MNKTILKWIWWGILICSIIWAWILFPSSKYNEQNLSQEIIFDKNIDRQQAAKSLLMLEINSSNLKKQSSKSKISSKKNVQNISMIETIKVYNDDDIINNFIWSSSSSIKNNSSSSEKNFETKNVSQNFCQNNEKLCQIVIFENDRDEKKLFSIKTILDRFWYDPTQYINSINIVENSNWRRWYATHSYIVINSYNQSQKEFWEVFTHELAHIIDLWVIKWNWEKDEKFTEFWNVIFAKNDPSIQFYKLSRDWEKVRKAWSKSQDFVSWYAMSDPFEDYAESFNMYINHKNLFLAMTRSSNILRQKYDIIDKQFWTKYFFEDNETTKKVEASPFWRPWDSTRMN